MLDFDVKRCTRKCTATEQDLKPGEEFYSVLVSQGAEVVRLDYSKAAWDGPPEGNIGWWKSRMPDPNEKKVDWAPSDVILHYFQKLAERPDSADTRYVLTLLMIRRRMLRLEESESADDGTETMILFCPKNETEYRVQVVDPSSDRVAAIQDELANLLFSMGTG
jgi:hypothetical protein